MPTALHLTPLSNVAAIRREGLIPKIGPRASAAGETKAAIWAFLGSIDKVALEYALVIWVSDAFSDAADPLALIEFDCPPQPSSAGSETIAIGHCIPPDRLRIRSLDIDTELEHETFNGVDGGAEP